MTNLRLRSNCRLPALVMTIAAVVATFTVWLLACGPFFDSLETVMTFEPAHRQEFGRGELTVVSPEYARRYLVQAYRVFSGRPPLANAALHMWQLHAAAESSGNTDDPLKDWTAACNRVLGGPAIEFEPFRRLPDYNGFQNCGDDGFRNAARTLVARISEYGESSAEVRDWTRAQVAVFRNCSEETLVLPEPPARAAAAAIRADRAYQTAAAYFYAMQYEEAARRFRAIGRDRSSPWRPYGRYLAARANIRRATLAAEGVDATRFFADAEASLKATLDDPDAAPLHRAAQGLLNFIAVRIHSIERLHALSASLSSAPVVSNQDLIDYRMLLDRLVDVIPAVTGVDLRQLRQNDDLTDWIVSMQRGAGDFPHILQRWRSSHSIPWLVAALWHLPPRDPAAAAIVDAARAVDRTSPAFPTVAFLLVRQLTAAGLRNDARELLATLPVSPAPGFLPETVNLLNAERVMLAQTLDELLASASRSIVNGRPGGTGSGALPDGRSYDEPVLGEDAAAVLTSRLPLDRLVDAAASDLLPARLRVRVAAAAFVRASVLQRDEVARRAAMVLSRLSPALQADVGRYLAATTAAEAHRAAVLLVVRTPGIRPWVLGGENEQSYEETEPARKRLEFHVNWWCSAELTRLPEAPWMRWLYPKRVVSYPAFLAERERLATEREISAVAAVGPAREYLAAEAIKWAKAKPDDIIAAEVLARVVDGWRHSCGYAEPGRWELSREAFRTLHRLYPQSEWAKRTRYWYK